MVKCKDFLLLAQFCYAKFYVCTSNCKNTATVKLTANYKRKLFSFDYLDILCHLELH